MLHNSVLQVQVKQDSPSPLTLAKPDKVSQVRSAQLVHLLIIFSEVSDLGRNKFPQNFWSYSKISVLGQDPEDKVLRTKEIYLPQRDTCQGIKDKGRKQRSREKWKGTKQSGKWYCPGTEHRTASV